MDSFDGGRRQDSRSQLPASERRSLRDPAERRGARDGDPLEQRLDRWVSAGRQLVDGVSGGRPGSRAAARRSEGRPGRRGGGFDGLGRWVEDRLDWLLEDGDDWREPWQQNEGGRDPMPPAERLMPRSPQRAGDRPASDDWQPVRSGERPREPGVAASSSRPRRPLEAISRRGQAPAAAMSPQVRANGEDGDQDWPDDALFQVPRWQRPPASSPPKDPLQRDAAVRRPDAGEVAAPRVGGRPLPRSCRRR